MVSVIIPVYNVEAYLNSCVESVLKLQCSFEVLLIDDGSTDGSGSLCDSWAQKDSRIRVIHQKNAGLSGARNTGIRNAKGSHVLFLDSDDFLDPKETDRMLCRLTGSTEVLLGLYNEYYTAENLFKRENCDAFLTLSGNVETHVLLGKLPADGRSCYLTAWRFVCQRDFLIRNSLLFLEGIYHEDEEWTQRLLCCTKHVFVTNCFFYQYRQARAGAITSSVKPKHLHDSLTIIRRAQELEKTYPNRAEYLHQRMGGLYLNALIHLQTAGTDKQELTKQMRQLRFCARYMRGIVGTVARLCVAVVGISATSTLLAMIRKIVK